MVAACVAAAEGKTERLHPCLCGAGRVGILGAAARPGWADRRQGVCIGELVWAEGAADQDKRDSHHEARPVQEGARESVTGAGPSFAWCKQVGAGDDPQGAHPFHAQNQEISHGFYASGCPRVGSPHTLGGLRGVGRGDVWRLPPCPAAANEL